MQGLHFFSFPLVFVAGRMEEEEGPVSESKTRNRLALERARKVAYIRSNSGSGVRGADE
jgi:hypothetical protein